MHQALLTGLSRVMPRSAMRVNSSTPPATARSSCPGLGPAAGPPPWLVAGEIVETTQVYARQCGAIEPDWLLRVNPRVLKRHHYEPAWQSGAVVSWPRSGSRCTADD